MTEPMEKNKSRAIGETKKSPHLYTRIRARFVKSGKIPRAHCIDTFQDRWSASRMGVYVHIRVYKRKSRKGDVSGARLLQVRATPHCENIPTASKRVNPSRSTPCYYIRKVPRSDQVRTARYIRAEGAAFFRSIHLSIPPWGQIYIYIYIHTPLG